MKETPDKSGSNQRSNLSNLTFGQKAITAPALTDRGKQFMLTLATTTNIADALTYIAHNQAMQSATIILYEEIEL